MKTQSPLVEKLRTPRWQQQDIQTNAKQFAQRGRCSYLEKLKSLYKIKN
jgi:hypothetical protein